jgi:small subunit ribosomal protein S11
MTEENKKPADEKKKEDVVITDDASTDDAEDTTKQGKYFRTAKGKRRAKKQVPKGLAYVQSSLNNTIVTITDLNGNVLCWSSSGNCGFRGPKKATPYAAGKVVEKLAQKAQQYGVKELSVFTKGIGNGRDAAVRSLNAQGFNITSMRETTPVPHNGCRARRPRRV